MGIGVSAQRVLAGGREGGREHLCIGVCYTCLSRVLGRKARLRRYLPE